MLRFDLCGLNNLIHNDNYCFIQVEYQKGDRYTLVTKASGWMLEEGREGIIRRKGPGTPEKGNKIPTDGWEYSISTGETET